MVKLPPVAHAGLRLRLACQVLIVGLPLETAAVLMVRSNYSGLDLSRLTPDLFPGLVQGADAGIQSPERSELQRQAMRHRKWPRRDIALLCC